METKDNTLESAILDVWKNAAENNMSGEQSFELGTDRYREHTQEMTPGQSEKKEVELDETNKNDKSDDGEGLDAVQKDAVKKKFKNRKDKDIDNDGDEDDSDEFLHKKRKAISKAIDAKESFNLRDTIFNMWVEASSAVNPNDRDELDKEVDGRGGAETAKKMKKAKEPTPMVATEDMSVEEAQKQKTLSMKEALAKVWGFEEGYGKIMSSKKKKMTPESKNGKTTETGGKMAEVEIDPELKNKK